MCAWTHSPASLERPWNTAAGRVVIWFTFRYLRPPRQTEWECCCGYLTCVCVCVYIYIYIYIYWKSRDLINIQVPARHREWENGSDVVATSRVCVYVFTHMHTHRHCAGRAVIWFTFRYLRPSRQTEWECCYGYLTCVYTHTHTQTDIAACGRPAQRVRVISWLPHMCLHTRAHTNSQSHRQGEWDCRRSYLTCVYTHAHTHTHTRNFT
jgi:hypothetical protein